MNKKMVLNWLSLVILIATSAYVPVSAPSEKNAQFAPEVRRVGLVVAYHPGDSITIVDRRGTEFPFELGSPLRIVPRSRANRLRPGAFVTVIAPNNVTGGKHIAVGIVIHPSVPPGFPVPPVPSTPEPPPPPGPTEPPTVTPPPGGTVDFPPPTDTFVPTAQKTTLVFSPTVDLSSLPPLRRPIVGYSFPESFDDWNMPIRVAAFREITIDSSETLTPVGVAEVGSNQSDPQIYMVTIDLVSTATEVQGQLVSLTTTETLDVTFERMPQIRNPERINSPYNEFEDLEPAPSTFHTIYADGVCFVLPTDNGRVKYCSKPTGFEEPASPVSVADNFLLQYAELQDLITPVAEQFDLETAIQLDAIISMQENIQHIEECASALTQEACAADVVVAPVDEQYLLQNYDDHFGEDDDDDGEDDDNGEDDHDDGEDDNGDDDDDPVSRIALAVAVMKVLRPIETSDVTILPGDYRLDYWFDANGVFYAATVTGVMTDNTQVVNQPVPAVPASLINASGDDPQQPGAQVSSCRLFRRCTFFQRSCG